MFSGSSGLSDYTMKSLNSLWRLLRRNDRWERSMQYEVAPPTVTLANFLCFFFFNEIWLTCICIQNTVFNPSSVLDSPSFVFCDFKLTKHLHFSWNIRCILCCFAYGIFNFAHGCLSLTQISKQPVEGLRGIHSQLPTPLRRSKLSLLSVRHTFCLQWRGVFGGIQCLLLH